MPRAYPHRFLAPYHARMKKDATAEQLLNDQLAACLAAMQDCLAHSRAPHTDDERGHLRRHDIAYVAKLVKASARLTEALAKLRGDTRHQIHVIHGKEEGDKGEG